jgi:hypothetical protein
VVEYYLEAQDEDDEYAVEFAEEFNQSGEGSAGYSGYPRSYMEREGFEFGEGAAEHGGRGARGAKQIELVAWDRTPFGLEGDAFHRGLWRLGFQRVTNEPHEHPQIERGGRSADPARVALLRSVCEQQRTPAETRRSTPRRRARSAAPAGS